MIPRWLGTLATSAPLSSLVAVAVAHAEFERVGDIEALLGTMESEPVYDLYPAGRRFSGMAATRRYYEHFFAEVQPRLRGATLLGEFTGPGGLAQEYAMSVLHPGQTEPTTHRILAVLTFGPERLSGERMYSDDRMLRFLVGPLWDELDPITSTEPGDPMP